MYIRNASIEDEIFSINQYAVNTASNIDIYLGRSNMDYRFLPLGHRLFTYFAWDYYGDQGFHTWDKSITGVWTVGTSTKGAAILVYWEWSDGASEQQHSEWPGKWMHPPVPRHQREREEREREERNEREAKEKKERELEQKRKEAEAIEQRKREEKEERERIRQSKIADAAVVYTGILYSADELRGILKAPSSAFEGFDVSKIEHYLHDNEFQQLMGMSKTDYNKLPKWKQVQLKTKAKLF